MWRKKLYRGNWYAVTNEGGKTKRVALRTADRDEADRQFHRFLAEKDGPKETISEILDAYKSDKSFKSDKTAKFCIRTLKPYWGHFKPDQVTRDMCRKYIEKRNRKNSTVRRELQVLKAALRWHDKNTTAVIEMPPPSPPRERVITKEEFDKLLNAAVSPHIRLFIILARATAARSNAILELTWDRVDFKRGLIQLSKGEDKNKRRALIPMTKLAREALEKAYEGRTCDSVIEFAGGPVKSVLIAFKRTAQRANLSGVTPHVLRHSAAVWMAEAGVPMSEISQYLGHTSTHVTERVYARYSPEYLKNAASALD